MKLVTITLMVMFQYGWVVQVGEWQTWPIAVS